MISTHGHRCFLTFSMVYTRHREMQGITQSASTGLGSLDLCPYPAPSLLSAAK